MLQPGLTASSLVPQPFRLAQPESTTPFLVAQPESTAPFFAGAARVHGALFSCRRPSRRRPFFPAQPESTVPSSFAQPETIAPLFGSLPEPTVSFSWRSPCRRRSLSWSSPSRRHLLRGAARVAGASFSWRSPSQRHLFFVGQPGSTPPLSWRCPTDGASFITAHVGGEVGASPTILRLGGIASFDGWGVFMLPMSARLEYRGRRFLSNDERVF